MESMKQQTVFVVDDDAAVCDSIKELVESVNLQAEVYQSAFAFLDAFDPRHPCCLVLDVRMAEMSGLVLQERLRTMKAGIPVIVLTAHGDVPMAVQAMRNGAVDFIQKPYREQALLDSINAALTRDASSRRWAGSADDFGELIADLTRREREVLDQVLTGSTSKLIARELGISPRTVEAHRKNLLRKLGIGSVKELILRLTSPRPGKLDP